MIHTRTKFFALIALGLFLGSLSVAIGMLWVVGEHKEKLHAARFRAAEAEMQGRALSALQETVSRSKEDRDTLRGYILADESIVDFLSLIDQVEREQGVELETTIDTISVDDVFEELQFSMRIEGSFDSIMRMIRILETLPKQSFVPEVTITRSGEEGENQWTAALTILVVKYKKV
jgi:hypothetical protein